ncbi:MAG: hypothetical protein LBE71_02670 [Dysgonamonadaceae bacterium]|jgi:hypothetical protein|nr:hypothetical protein [Dysgonamonadaceae bacterium]
MDLISLYFLGLLCAFAPVIASEAKQSGENPTRHCERSEAIQREKGGSLFYYT